MIPQSSQIVRLRSAHVPTPWPSGSNRGPARLPTFASALTDAEWQTRVPKDGRKIGVVVHHVATMYPLEIQLAQTLAARPAGGGCDLG